MYISFVNALKNANPCLYVQSTKKWMGRVCTNLTHSLNEFINKIRKFINTLLGKKEPTPQQPQKDPQGLLNSERIAELAQVNSRSGEIINTGLTEFLSRHTFEHSSNPKLSKEVKNEINLLIESLVNEAKKGNENALRALRLPNNPGENISGKANFGGFPQNTPLALLIKMGNAEGVKLILSAYEKEDLLFTTPRGNSALHLALLTGQIDCALAIFKRAKELNVADELCQMKNRAGITAEACFDAIKQIKTKFIFRSYLDFTDPLFGGEEVNKANVGYFYQNSGNMMSFRDAVSGQLKAIKPNILAAELRFHDIFCE